MPGMSGVEATRRLLARAPDARGRPDVLRRPRPGRRRAGRGAVGYLLKDAEPDGLVAASARRRAASRRWTRAARGAAARSRGGLPASVLFGPRGRGAGAGGRGLANKQIARNLGIAERTVKAHLTSIFTQIGVTDRTSAALWAHRRGLVGTPPKARRAAEPHGRRGVGATVVGWQRTGFPWWADLLVGFLALVLFVVVFAVASGSRAEPAQRPRWRRLAYLTTALAQFDAVVFAGSLVWGVGLPVWLAVGLAVLAGVALGAVLTWLCSLQRRRRVNALSSA